MVRVNDVAAAAERIETTMRELGWWSDLPPDAERMNFKVAFGGDTLAFQEWIQWVLLPRVAAGISDGSLPSSSQVGDYAVREFDGVDEAEPLIRALQALDAAVNDG